MKYYIDKNFFSIEKKILNEVKTIKRGNGH